MWVGEKCDTTNKGGRKCTCNEGGGGTTTTTHAGVVRTVVLGGTVVERRV